VRKALVAGALLLFTTLPPACVTLTSEGELVVRKLGELSEEEFAILADDVRLISELGVRRLVAERPELRDPARSFLARARDLVHGGGAPLADFARGLIDEIEDPDVRILVQLAMNRIRQQGGFEFLETEAGEILTDRGALLIEALADGASRALRGS
jgi:hypothetical protein